MTPTERLATRGEYAAGGNGGGTASYARMDHAGWIESNNSAINRYQSRRKDYKPLPEKLNDFQAQGIYDRSSA